MRHVESKFYEDPEDKHLKESSIHERIGLLIDHYCHGNKTAFGRETHILPGVLASIVGGRMSKPSFELLQKIMTRYPAISGDWLVMGRGEMIKEALSEEKPAARHTSPKLKVNLSQLPKLPIAPIPINTELLARLDLVERVLKELVNATPDEVAQRIREVGMKPEDLDIEPEE